MSNACNVKVSVKVTAALPSHGIAERGGTGSAKTRPPASPPRSEAAPWTLSEFSRPPCGKSDKWIEDYMSEGWLIRAHGKMRKRLFHPVHRSCPIDCSLLLPQRTTLVFHEGKAEAEIHEDLWTKSTAWKQENGWKGYTFFRMDSAPQADCPSASSQSEEDDGFELVSS